MNIELINVSCSKCQTINKTKFTGTENTFNCSILCSKCKETLVILNFKNMELKRCIDCGSEFQSDHGHRKFCPPKPGNKRSSCENRYNQRLKRARRKEKRRLSK